MKYIFEGDDLQRIQNIHGGFLPPLGIICDFKDRYPGEVKFSESRSGGDGYWVKVSIEDAGIQAKFESCVLRRSFDWTTRSIRLEKVRKIRIQRQLQRFPYKVKTTAAKVFYSRDHLRAQQWWDWCTKKFGRRDIKGRWYQHDGVSYFMHDRDALLYQLHVPF